MNANALYNFAIAIRAEMDLADNARAREGVAEWAVQSAAEYKTAEDAREEIERLARGDWERANEGAHLAPDYGEGIAAGELCKGSAPVRIVRLIRTIGHGDSVIDVYLGRYARFDSPCVFAIDNDKVYAVGDEDDDEENARSWKAIIEHGAEGAVLAAVALPPRPSNDERYDPQEYVDWYLSSLLRARDALAIAEGGHA